MIRRLFAKPPPPPRQDPLDVLRMTILPETAFQSGDLVPELWFNIDPDAGISGTWCSPAGRMLEVRTQVSAPGGWCGLHLALPDVDVAACRYFGFVARTAAAQAITLRACLRSGTDDGFHDHFFARDILSQAAPGDHLDAIVPAECPDIPRDALWREFVLFVPPNRSVTWSLHDLRLIVL